MTGKLLSTIHESDSQQHLCEFIIKQNETFYQKVFDIKVDFSGFKSKLMESDLSPSEHLFMINSESLDNEILNDAFEKMFCFECNPFKELKEVNEKRNGDYLFCLSRKSVYDFGNNFVYFGRENSWKCLINFITIPLCLRLWTKR
jgi:hypothetical protein